MMAVAIANSVGYGVGSWSSWNGAVSGYPSGAFLVTQGNRTSYNPQKPNTATYASSNGCRVTVEDAHGSHTGTPTMSKKYVIPSSNIPGAVAVRHEAADSGWMFLGWRVTRKPYYSGSSYTMAYLEILSGAAGDTDGLVTFYPAAALGDSALVIKIPYKVDSNYDELIIEAVYVDATKCVLSFEPNADDAEAPPIPDVTIGIGTSGRLPTPGLWKRLGYAFLHWNTAADGSGESYEANALYTPAEGSYLVTMYAQWAKVGGEGAKCSYLYVSDDGTAHSTYTEPFCIDISLSGVADDVGEVEVKYQTRKRSSWTQTKTSYNSGTGKTTTTTENLSDQGPTVDEVFSIGPGAVLEGFKMPADYISYTYYSSKVYGSQGSYTRTVDYSHCSVLDSWTWEAPEIPGYDFEGWFTISESYTEKDEAKDRPYSTLITSERMTTWGVLEDGMNAARTHYAFRFEDYYTSVGYLNFLRLVYRGKKLRVKFDANGGELDDLYREVRRLEGYGEMPIPTRPGYTFVGWSTQRIGGELVTAETVVTTLEDHTLFARWDRVPVMMTVCFVPCGGTVEPAEKTVKSGEAYGDLPTPVRDGFEFKGWFTASLGGSAVTADTVVGRTYTHWLYAQWSKPGDDAPLPSGGSAYLFDVI
jgi:uncharacterized repeat protein (TIGR02543 family)